MPRVLTPEDLKIIEELSSEFWRDFMLPIEVKRYRDFGGLAGAAAVVRRAVERGLVDDDQIRPRVGSVAGSGPDASRMASSRRSLPKRSASASGRCVASKPGTAGSRRSN